MKFLVIGLGSIGERHIGNLLQLGYKDIITHRRRNLPLRTLGREFPVYPTLESALNEKPDVALVCNPTHLHQETTRACLEAGCHVFVEKPLSHTSEGLGYLQALAESRSLKVMVGYMMRFHPCLQKIKAWLQSAAIGRLIHVRSQWGEYLPDWHPWEDYRESYAALNHMGGGPGLTLSHEIDTLLWLCGPHERVVSLSNYSSDLEIDTEHGVDFLVKFPEGLTAAVHVDYYQSPPARTLELVGSEGRISFDYYQSKAILYKRAEQEVQEILDVSETFDRNDLFLMEMQYFLDAIKLARPVEPGLKEGREVLRFLEEAREAQI